MDKLTGRQFDILLFVNEYRAKEQCNPTMREIADRFGWKSSNASHTQIFAMSRKGVVELRPGKSRGYVVVYPYSESMR